MTLELALEARNPRKAGSQPARVEYRGATNAGPVSLLVEQLKLDPPVS